MKNMKIPLLFVLAMLSVALLTATTADAYSPKQIRKAFDGCLKFLSKPLAEQKKIAKRTGYTLRDTRWACQLLVKNGVNKSIELELEYQNWRRAVLEAERESSSSSGGGWTHQEDNSCSSSHVNCRLNEHCVGGQCKDSSFNKCQTTGIDTCPPGESCADGICK